MIFFRINLTELCKNLTKSWIFIKWLPRSEKKHFIRILANFLRFLRKIIIKFIYFVSSCLFLFYKNLRKSCKNLIKAENMKQDYSLASNSKNFQNFVRILKISVRFLWKISTRFWCLILSFLRTFCKNLRKFCKNLTKFWFFGRTIRRWPKFQFFFSFS